MATNALTAHFTTSTSTELLSAYIVLNEIRRPLTAAESALWNAVYSELENRFNVRIEDGFDRGAVDYIDAFLMAVGADGNERNCLTVGIFMATFREALRARGGNVGDLLLTA